jgi:hypothetical protein
VPWRIPKTKDLLVKTADWLTHATLLEKMPSAAVVTPDGEMTKAKTKANNEWVHLKTVLPKEVEANVSVNDVSADRLPFAKERAFAVINAMGKTSAQLKP